MSINKVQLREGIREVLKMLEPTIRYTQEAEDLLMLTAAVESDLGRYLVQRGGGPALGIFQMEPNTHDDIYDNFLKFRPTIMATVLKFATPQEGTFDLQYNLAYQIVMCRVHYLRVPQSIPKTLTAQAEYWKRHYNTFSGKGATKKAEQKYLEYAV